MKINPAKLKPNELVRLLNSTQLGTVTERTKIFRHRQQVGYRISSDGTTVNLFQYLVWLVDIPSGTVMALQKLMAIPH
jgi:hypothetical protein